MPIGDDRIMVKKTYNKLVRDNIPDIIQKKGGKVVYTTLDDNRRFLRALDCKLAEELVEYRESGDIEELADLLEVIYAAAKLRGCSEKELNKVRKTKAKERGKFERRLFLVETWD